MLSLILLSFFAALCFVSIFAFFYYRFFEIDLLTRKSKKSFFLAFVLTTIFLILSFVFLPTFRSSYIIPNVTPTPLAPPPIEEIKLKNLDIIIDTPHTMLINHSYVIKVRLVPRGEPVISSLILEKATAVATNVTLVGTPEATTKNAFGRGYEVSAVAYLSPEIGPFIIKNIPPNKQNVQQLNQPQVEWKFSVIPNDMGKQVLDVDIEAVWRSTNLPTWGPYRIGDKQFSIEVNSPPPTPTPIPIPTPTPTPTPFVVPGQFNISSLVTTLFSILLGAGGLGAATIIYIAKSVKDKSKKDLRNQQENMASTSSSDSTISASVPLVSTPAMVTPSVSVPPAPIPPPITQKTKEQWIEEGNTLLNNKKYKEALSAFEKAIELDPINALLYNKKGVCLYGLSRYQEALIAFEKAIELDPSYDPALSNIDKTLEQFM